MTHQFNRRFTRSKLFLSVAATAAILAGSNTYAEGLVLEEIVVTAQKRAESLQDVASSIVAVTSEALDNNGITEFSDAAKMVPGLNMKQTNATNTSISLRGLTYNRQSAGSESVDTYWNGTTYSSVAVFSSMFDVDRLEILRGPQGTLQGKTSPGGAIHLHTKVPVFDAIEGQIKTSLADDGSKIGEFGVSLPLSDTLAVRLAGIYNSNEAGGNKQALSGLEDTANVRAGRITVAWQPSDDFDAVVRHEYLEQSVRDVFQMAGSGHFGDIGLEDKTGLMARRHEVELQTDISTLEMNWHNLGNHDVTGLMSYSSTEILDNQDRDLANFSADPNNILNVINAYENLGLDNETQFHSTGTNGDTYTYSSELRIDRNDDSWWQYTAGLYYAKTNNHVISNADLVPSSGAVQTTVDVSIETEEFGYFSHNRIELSEVSELQVGLRYSRTRRDDRTEQFAGTGYTLGTDQFVNGSFAYVNCGFTSGAACAAMPDVNGMAANTLITGQSSGVLVDSPNGVSDAFTGGIKYLHDINDDTMAYASVDVSYRLDATSLNPRIIEHADDLAFNEEDTLAFEVGLKSTVFDGRLQLNAALYYQQLDEYQNYFKEMPLSDSGSSFSDGVVANVDAISQGIELEAVGLISENWQAAMALSYNDFKFADGEQGPCNNGQAVTAGSLYNTCDLSGQRVSDNANWGLTASTEYTLSLNSVDAFVRGFYQFNGWTQSPGILGKAGQTGSYGVVDLFAGVRSKDQQWELSIWSKNLLNKVAESEKFAPESGILDIPTGYRQVEVIDGRSIGASLRYNFSM